MSIIMMGRSDVRHIVFDLPAYYFRHGGCIMALTWSPQ